MIAKTQPLPHELFLVFYNIFLVKKRKKNLNILPIQLMSICYPGLKFKNNGTNIAIKLFLPN